MAALEGGEQTVLACEKTVHADVDRKFQLVAKFLRAMKNGTLHHMRFTPDSTGSSASDPQPSEGRMLFQEVLSSSGYPNCSTSLTTKVLLLLEWQMAHWQDSAFWPSHHSKHIKHHLVQSSIQTSLLFALPQLHAPVPSQLRQELPEPVWQTVASFLTDTPLSSSWWEKSRHPVFLMGTRDGRMNMQILAPSDCHTITYFRAEAHHELCLNDLQPDKNWATATSDELRQALESFCDGRPIRPKIPNVSTAMHAVGVSMRLSAGIPLLSVGVVGGDAARGLLSVVGDMLGAADTKESTLGEFYTEFTIWECRAQDSDVDAGPAPLAGEAACPPLDRRSVEAFLSQLVDSSGSLLLLHCSFSALCSEAHAARQLSFLELVLASRAQSRPVAMGPLNVIGYAQYYDLMFEDSVLSPTLREATMSA